MAIDLNDGYAELMLHRAHEISVVSYGPDAMNVAIQCEECFVVLVDFDRPDEAEVEVLGKNPCTCVTTEHKHLLIVDQFSEPKGYVYTDYWAARAEMDRHDDSVISCLTEER